MKLPLWRLSHWTATDYTYVVWPPHKLAAAFPASSACHNIYANPRWKSSRAIGMSETNKCQTGHINKIECHATLLNIFWQFILFLFSRCLLYIITVWRVFGERVASSRVQQCKIKHKKKTGGKLNFYLCAATFFMRLSQLDSFHFFCFCFLYLFFVLFFGLLSLHC